MGTHLWAIWADLSPFVPRKTTARAEERLRGRENRFPELSSLPSILQKLTALACHTGTSVTLRTSRKGLEPCSAVVAWPSVPLPVDAGRGQQNKGPSKMSPS